MYIVVGLGNPGLKYENTRHNAGFMTIDELSKELNIDVKRNKFKALIGEGNYNNEKIILVKPQTYMNDSGLSVKDITNFYNIEKDKLIIVLDDIDIEFGTIRIKRAGSAGSHNGMKSIIYQLAYDDFPRVKIAIGKNPSYMDLADFVLSRFTKDEKKVIDEEVQNAKNAVLNIINNGLDDTMNKYNSWSAF